MIKILFYRNTYVDHSGKTRSDLMPFTALQAWSIGALMEDDGINEVDAIRLIGEWNALRRAYRQYEGYSLDRPADMIAVTEDVFFSNVGALDVHPRVVGTWPYTSLFAAQDGTVHGKIVNRVNGGVKTSEFYLSAIDGNAKTD